MSAMIATNVSESSSRPHRYRAFISYSHAADGRLAPLLQSALQKFAKPWYKLRSVRLFRDQTSLSVTPALWPAIKRALLDSEYFVLLASEEAARSEWVQRETETWLNAEPRSSHMLLVVTGGEIHWDEEQRDFDWVKTTALPPTLSRVFNQEPLYLDLRWATVKDHLSMAQPRFRDAVASLSATLSGRDKDEIVGEDVRQHRRAVRTAWSVGVVLLLLTALSLMLATLARQQSELAQRNEREAITERENAQARLAQSLLSEGHAMANMDRWGEARHRYGEGFDVTRAFGRPTGLASVALWIASWRSNHSVQRFLGGGSRVIHARVIAHDRIVTVTETGAISVYSLPSGERTRRLQTELRHVSAADAKFNAGEEIVVLSSAYDGTARSWDVSKSRELASVSHGVNVMTVALSPDGCFAGSGDADGLIKVWNTRTGAEHRQFKVPIGVMGLAFSPAGRFLVSGDSFKVEVWNLEANRHHKTLPGHKGLVLSVAVSPAGDTVLSADSAGTVILWEFATGKPVFNVRADKSGISRVRFTSDGTHFLTASWSGLVRLWDANNGRLVREFHGHTLGLADVSPSADGKLAVSAGYDGTARLWRLGGSVDLLRVATGREGASAVAMTPDGRDRDRG